LSSFYERPILNSPYRAPELHHPLDDNGQPLAGEPRRGRRPSRFIVPVPASRKKASLLRGSGYPEGYLFTWVVSDFSVMDAIESGIVKLPRMPVTDILVQTDSVIYRDLWKHIGNPGNLELFQNYDDQGGRLARPRTLLIDSRQIESGDALDKGFRDAAGPEIEQFKRERANRRRKTVRMWSPTQRNRRSASTSPTATGA
jgi:hypothetical protein